MSHDIFLNRVVGSEKSVCSPQEAQACVDLLRSINSDKLDEFNFLRLEFQDGSTVEISIWEDATAITGCAFYMRGLSKPLIEFIFDMSLAGNFVILDSSGTDNIDDSRGPLAIMTSPETLNEVGPNIFKHPRLCESVPELAEIFGI